MLLVVRLPAYVSRAGQVGRWCKVSYLSGYR